MQFNDHHPLAQLRTLRLEIKPWEDDDDDPAYDCDLLLRILQSRNTCLVPKLQRLEVTAQLVRDCHQFLQDLVDDLVLI
jgi:hypothetical protein